MENNQINFFKSPDPNSLFKPRREERIVKIEKYESKEINKDLNVGIFGWYSVCPSKELKKNKLYFFSLYDQPLLIFRDKQNNVRCVKNVCPHRGAAFYEGSFSNNELTCPYHGAKFSPDGSCQNIGKLTCSHIIDSNYEKYAKKIHLSQYQTIEKDNYIYINYSQEASVDIENIEDSKPFKKYELSNNGFEIDKYVFEEVMVDFKCDWTRIIENHLDILHIFWVHGDTIPDKDVNREFLVSFKQKINIENDYIETIYYYKNKPSLEFIRIRFLPPGRILIYKGEPNDSRYLQVLDHIPLGNNKARVLVRHYRKFMKNKFINNIILFKEIQKRTFYKIFNEDYMILKTQTHNHKLGLIRKDEIKLLGEDRIIKYFWEWYDKSEIKDDPWKISRKIENNMDVFDKLIFKYPPEIKRLDVLNNLKIIRKTFVTYVSPLILFLLII